MVESLVRSARLSLLAATTTAILAAVNPAAADSLPDAPAIAGLESRTADVGDGVVLHYWIGGKGAPLVLLHGWPETGYAWRNVAPKSLLDDVDLPD